MFTGRQGSAYAGCASAAGKLKCLPRRNVRAGASVVVVDGDGDGGGLSEVVVAAVAEGGRPGPGVGVGEGVGGDFADGNSGGRGSANEKGTVFFWDESP